jgi:phosphate transport system substrate-binding protein
MSQKNETPILIVSLLVTAALIGGGVWFLMDRKPNLFGNLLGSFKTSTGTASPGTQGTSSPESSSITGDNFTSVSNVPNGLFSYGGSTTWAPIRGKVDPEITKALPGFQLRYTNPTSGTAGSSTGIRMLLENQLAFAQSSRAPKPEEYQQAEQRGFKIKDIAVALEGIAIAVRPDLNVPGLTLTQLKDIYTGRVTNWRQLNGPDLPIVPFSRQVADSGTVEFFVENVLANQSFGSNVRLISTTTEALRQVGANPGAIYFASAPEVVGQCSVKPLPIGQQAGQFVPPYQEPLIPPAQCPAQKNQLNAEALQNAQYPLTRRLFVVIKQDGQIDQQAGEAYANLLLTNQGQDLLTQAGFVRIR